MRRKPREEQEHDLVPAGEGKPAGEDKPEPGLNASGNEPEPGLNASEDKPEHGLDASEPSETHEMELNELLSEIREKAREGTIEEEAEAPISGVWEEEKEEEKETTAEDTATFLVELADMATTNICAAVAGISVKEAEKLWSFSAKEKERLHKAAVPVLSKYGVDMPPEIILALTLFQIEFPRIMAARQMRNQQAEGKEQANEENETGTFWN